APRPAPRISVTSRSLPSTLQHDMRIPRVAITLAYRFLERSLLHPEHGSRVHAAEIVSGRQRLQLGGGERRFAAEYRISPQQEIEQSVGDAEDQGMQSLHALDRADDVDVVDPCVADNVIDIPVGLALQAHRDAATEVAFVKR